MPFDLWAIGLRIIADTRYTSDAKKIGLTDDSVGFAIVEIEPKRIAETAAHRKPT